MKWRSLSVCMLPLALLVAFPSAAQESERKPSMRRAVGQAIWTAATQGRTTRIGEGGGITVIAPVGAATAGAAAGSAKVAGTATVTVAGQRVPANISAEVGKEAMAGAVVGCATGGIAGCVLGVATPLAIAYLSLSGSRISPQTGELERQDPERCYSEPCFYWRIQDGGFDSGQQISGAEAFRVWAAQYNAGPATAIYTMIGTAASGWPLVKITDKSSGSVIVASAEKSGDKTSRPPDSPTWYPATPQEVRDALYNHNPPPALHDELAKFGNIVWSTGIPNISGPAVITGPKSVTTHSDGSTTTKQTSTPMTYGPGTITAGNPTTTSVSRDAQGNETGTTTTTEEPGNEPEAEQPPEPAPTDTELPPVPDLYTRKYPDGLVGIWNEKSAEIKQAPLFQLAGDLMPTVGSSGSCPSWPVNFDFAAWAQFGTRDVAPPCNVWEWARVFVIIGALLLARALIFGG